MTAPGSTPAGALRVEVLRDRCMAVGACAHTAPGVFAVDDETSVATVIGDPGTDAAAVRLAVEECPMAALELVEG